MTKQRRGWPAATYSSQGSHTNGLALPHPLGMQLGRAHSHITQCWTQSSSPGSESGHMPRGWKCPPIGGQSSSLWTWGAQENLCNSRPRDRLQGFQLPTAQFEKAGWWDPPPSLHSLHCDKFLLLGGLRSSWDIKETRKGKTLALAKALKDCSQCSSGSTMKCAALPGASTSAWPIWCGLQRKTSLRPCRWSLKTTGNQHPQPQKRRPHSSVSPMRLKLQLLAAPSVKNGLLCLRMQPTKGSSDRAPGHLSMSATTRIWSTAAFGRYPTDWDSQSRWSPEYTDASQYHKCGCL